MTILEKNLHAHATLAALREEFGFYKLSWAIQTAKAQNKSWEEMHFHERVRAIEEILRKKEDPQALILQMKHKPSKIKYSTFGTPIKEEI